MQVALEPEAQYLSAHLSPPQGLPPLPPPSHFTLFLWSSGEQCGGCRRSNTTDRPHAFQVILADRPCLELSADSEAEMADWMQHLCQAVSKGVIPQGVAPSPCIPCCLVITGDRLFTCHEDCQTSFFRSLGTARLADIAAISTELGKEYCVLVSGQEWGHRLCPGKAMHIHLEPAAPRSSPRIAHSCSSPGSST